MVHYDLKLSKSTPIQGSVSLNENSGYIVTTGTLAFLNQVPIRVPGLNLKT